MSKQKTVKSGWAFTRVSTARQAERQHGSLEQQRHMIDRWATEQSLKTDTKFKIIRYVEEDTSGREKNIKNRPALAELENAIISKKIDFFVIEKIDRLSRDQIFNLKIMRLAQANGVEAYTYESGLIDMKNSGNRMMFHLRNMSAEEGSIDLQEKISKKQREAMFNNGKDTSCKPILGLDRHPTKSCFYKINKIEQEQAILIFKKFLELGSLKATVSFCKQRGFKTKVIVVREKINKEGEIIPEHTRGGEDFDTRTLRSFLSSDKLRGISVFTDTYNQFPSKQDENGYVKWEYGHYTESGPVIPIELWEAAQARLDKNKQDKTRTSSETNVYLLSGILFKKDGGKIIGASAKSGSNRYYEDRRGGGEFRIPKEEIEKVICARIKEFLRDSGVLQKVLNSSDDQRNQQAEDIARSLETTKSKIKVLEKAKVGISSHIRSEAIKEGADIGAIVKMLSDEVVKIDEEIAQKMSEQSRLQRELVVINEDFQQKKVEDLLAKALKDFDRRCDLEKRQIIQTIIPRIVVHHDKLELYFNFLGARPEDRKPGGQKFDLDKNGSDSLWPTTT